MTRPNSSQFDQTAIRGRYDFIARWHDTASWLTTPHRRKAVRALKVGSGQCVLDLACGTGINFGNIMTGLGDSGLLLGLDYSSGMLKEAQRCVKRNRWNNVTVFLGTAGRLPFAGSIFDRVICTYALKVIPPYREALDEVVRILKPGGKFVVLDAKLGSGVTRFLNPLMQWVARGPMSDLARPLIEEIGQRFQDVQISEYNFGHVFVATARKA